MIEGYSRIYQFLHHCTYTTIYAPTFFIKNTALKNRQEFSQNESLDGERWRPFHQTTVEALKAKLEMRELLPLTIGIRGNTPMAVNHSLLHRNRKSEVHKVRY